MIGSRNILTLVVILFGVGAASAAQDATPMEKVAAALVAKYQKTSCTDLAAKKQEPPSDASKKVMALLKANPEQRTKFINLIAAPIVNKMFDCGLIQ